MERRTKRRMQERHGSSTSTILALAHPSAPKSVPKSDHEIFNFSSQSLFSRRHGQFERPARRFLSPAVVEEDQYKLVTFACSACTNVRRMLASSFVLSVVTFESPFHSRSSLSKGYVGTRGGSSHRTAPQRHEETRNYRPRIVDRSPQS